MIKQNPFSLYDFLGYFIPGALLIYISLFINNDIELENFQLTLDKNKNFQLENFLIFIILSYSFGHLINFLSSITVERYANWKYNYPSKYLMNLVPNHKFWIGSSKIKLWKIILFILLLPVTLFDILLGEIFAFKIFYTKKVDDYIIEAVKHKGLILLDQLGTPITKKLRDYDFHRIFSHYVYENSKNHQSKLTNYVVLYGFLRTLCLITVIMIWFIFFKIINKIDLCSSFKSNWEIIKYQFLVTLFLSLISYIFFMAFMKFYRRYSLETLMLIIIDKDLKGENSKRKKIENE